MLENNPGNPLPPLEKIPEEKQTRMLELLQKIKGVTISPEDLKDSRERVQKMTDDQISLFCTEEPNVQDMSTDPALLTAIWERLPRPKTR